MAGWKRFEDMEVWKRGCELVCEVYRVTREGKWAKDFAFIDQMRRAALSIPSNIAEGFERNSDKAFAGMLTIAKASAGELRTQLYIAARLGYLGKEEMSTLVGRTTEISRKLATLIKYLRKPRETP